MLLIFAHKSPNAHAVFKGYTLKFCARVLRAHLEV